jgi:hypothetical protein
MSFTLGDVQTAVQARGYGADTAAQQLGFAQAALRRLYSLRRWRFMEASGTTVAVAGIPAVSLPASTRSVDAVRLAFGTDHIDLDYLPQEELRAFWYTDRTPDEPRYWTLDRGGSSVFLWPVPNKVYTVEFDTIVRSPIPPDAATAVPLLPDEFLDVVTNMVCADTAARQRDWNAVGYWREQYQTLLTELVKTYALDQRQSSREVARWDGWEDVER